MKTVSQLLHNSIQGKRVSVNSQRKRNHFFLPVNRLSIGREARPASKGEDGGEGKEEGNQSLSQSLRL